MAGHKTYIAIDLKSFYASQECVERGLDPLTTNLVVADAGRTEKTICLAVSPSLKAHGSPGRARLFEVVQKVKEINAMRRANAPGAASCSAGRRPKWMRSALWRNFPRAIRWNARAPAGRTACPA